MSNRNPSSFLPSLILCGTIFGAVGTVRAATVDLTVSSIEVTQGFQNGTTTLVGGRAAMVRVKVGVAGSASAVAGVDAVLRMFVNGVESTAGPFYSMNGPISAPLSPSSATIDHTLNFIVVPPISTSVVFKVLVNPIASVPETNYGNNLFTSSNYQFACRKVVELAYVPINYTPGGGLPPAEMMLPGDGDNYLRGIYAVGEWNYHRSPLGNLTWSQNVNNSSSSLLNTLLDIRNNQIPAAGYAKPEFVYGWLPGNPYSGNGVAIGIPGAVAFGNTAVDRYQRTFAHEIGHLWGRSHNSATSGVPSIDVEHHLKVPLDLPQLQPSNKNDVMVAGLLTNQAWVAAVTYNGCLTDARSQCSGSSPPPPGGGDGNDNGDVVGAPVEMPCLRVAGVLTQAGRTVQISSIFDLPSVTPSVDDPEGDVAVEAFDGRGRLLHRVRMRTDTMMERCSGDGINPDASIYVLFPNPAGAARIDRVVVRDLAPGPKQGQVLASRDRSATAPIAEIVSVWPALGVIPPAGGDWKAAPVEVTWSAADADGGPLSFMLLYSHDGGQRWAPVTVNGEGSSVVFDPANLPGAAPGKGTLKLLASDGFNTTEVEAPIPSFLMALNPPDIHVLSPNADNYRRGASVLLHASGWDLEDTYLPDSALVWWSNVDGVLGTGRLLTTTRLTPGPHTITLLGVDSGGLSTTDTVALTITPRSIPTVDINGDGVVNGADLALLLGNWGNFGIGDLTFDGTVDGNDLAMLLGKWTS